MELRPGLHRIEAPLGERFVAMYLLVGSESALLVDTGISESVTDTLLPYLESIGFSLTTLRWVVSSHCDFDHTGGNAALLAAAPHVELLAGADDVPLTEDLQVLIDERYGEFRETDGFDDPPETTAYIREVSGLAHVTRSLVGGETISLGDRELLVLHAPGHSKGHLAIWDASNSALVIADATLGETVPTADGRPAFPPTYRDADPYLATIAMFREYRADLLLTAHYPVYEGDGVDGFLTESEHYVTRLDDAILGALGAGAPLTTLELIRRIAADVGSWDAAAADYLIFPVTGNLERLVELGRVRVSSETLPRTWQAVAA
jgi:glyoxylase-like metal-dependent hydrolase (beta-lactamase superfamily II)